MSESSAEAHNTPPKAHSLLIHLQYGVVWSLLKVLGWFPRRMALDCGWLFAKLAFAFIPRLRRVAYRNLELAFPEKNQPERKRIAAKACSNLGRLLGEFSQLPKLNSRNIGRLVEYDGLEHYQKAREQGNGVLFLTGHFGVWELSAFAHALFGYPMSIVVRRIDNPLVEQLVDRYRTASGNRTLDKMGSTRAILTALRKGETVGILADLNMVRNQGVFCDFFGIPACSTPMLATLALRTKAAVLPGFLIWDERLGKYRLHFEPALELIETGDPKQDIEVNTAQFMKAIENMIRRHPDHWLWIHRRWKTRPEGEPDLYAKRTED
ncbi:MAG: lysophospholipid acyltransferase family protein [Blastocatellia bacterium]|nr:lysophospholipid acyltransferase family protein [Blastocatellia bacterium]